VRSPLIELPFGLGREHLSWVIKFRRIFSRLRVAGQRRSEFTLKSEGVLLQILENSMKGMVPKTFSPASLTWGKGDTLVTISTVSGAL
jgi:hypothetical protein